VLALGGCIGPAEPSLVPGPRLATDPRPGALTVVPAAGLFDVTLRPGDVHVAEAAVTNDARTPLAVTMTTVVDGVAGAGDATPDALVSGLLAASCGTAPTATPTAADAATLGSGRVVALGTVQPGETSPLCGVLSLPADTALPPGASVTFSVVLTSVERPADASADAPWTVDPPDLARLTAHALPIGTAAGAGVLLAAALLLNRRRTGPSAPVGDQPTPEDLA
jgi:hypothetical protein